MAKKKLTLEDLEPSLEDKLYSVRQEISQLTLLSKKYAHQLMEDMLEHGQRRGKRFKVALRQSLKIVESDTAFKWAAERNCITVDSKKAMQLIRREFTVPEGFEIQSTQYLTLAGKTKETDSDNGDGD